MRNNRIITYAVGLHERGNRMELKIDEMKRIMLKAETDAKNRFEALVISIWCAVIVVLMVFFATK